MARIYGQLEWAQLHNLADDGSTYYTAKGMVWFNTAENRAKFGDGTRPVALLANDQKAVFGTHATASTNVRFNRAGTALLQLVTGDDTTDEGSISTAVAQFSARQQNYVLASRPSAASAGRLLWISDQNRFDVDTGSTFKTLVDTDSSQTLSNKSYALGMSAASKALSTDASGNLQAALLTVAYMSSGAANSGDVPTANGSGGVAWAAQAARAAENIVKSASSGANNISTTSKVDVVNLTLSITTSGRSVDFWLEPDGSGSGAYIGLDNTTASTADFFVYRGATLVAQFFCNSQSAGQAIPISMISGSDSPVAGTYTYKVMIQKTTSTSGTGVVKSKLVVRENV